MAEITDEQRRRSMETRKLMELLRPPEEPKREYPYEDDLTWRFVLPLTGLLLILGFIAMVKLT